MIARLITECFARPILAVLLVLAGAGWEQYGYRIYAETFFLIFPFLSSTSSCRIRPWAPKS